MLSETGSKSDLNFWKKLPAISVHDVACLLCDIDPRAITNVCTEDGSAPNFNDEVQYVLSHIHASVVLSNCLNYS